MKNYEVIRIRKYFKRESTEELRKDAEETLNRKSAEGWNLEKIDFELTEQSGYIYAFIVLSK